MIDDPSKWDDLNEVKKANPNLGVSITLDVIKEDIAAANVSLPAKIEFLCKRCNIKQNSSCAWLRTEVIEKCFGPITIDGVEYSTITPEAIAHSYSVGGIDLSKTGDLTSANIVVEKLNEIYVIAHFWLPSEMLQVATTRDHLPYSKYIEQGFLSLSGTNTIDYHVADGTVLNGDLSKIATDLPEDVTVNPTYDGRHNTYLFTGVAQFDAKAAFTEAFAKIAPAA